MLFLLILNIYNLNWELFMLIYRGHRTDNHSYIHCLTTCNWIVEDWLRFLKVIQNPHLIGGGYDLNIDIKWQDSKPEKINIFKDKQREIALEIQQNTSFVRKNNGEKNPIPIEVMRLLTYVIGALIGWYVLKNSVNQYILYWIRDMLRWV